MDSCKNLVFIEFTFKTIHGLLLLSLFLIIKSQNKVGNKINMNKWRHKMIVDHKIAKQKLVIVEYLQIQPDAIEFLKLYYLFIVLPFIF